MENLQPVVHSMLSLIFYFIARVLKVQLAFRFVADVQFTLFFRPKIPKKLQRVAVSILKQSLYWKIEERMFRMVDR
jgi:hypothetical protein